MCQIRSLRLPSKVLIPYLQPQESRTHQAFPRAHQPAKAIPMVLTSGVHFDVTPDCVPLFRVWLEEADVDLWRLLGAVSGRPHVVLILKVITTPMLFEHVVHIGNHLAPTAVDGVDVSLRRPHAWAPHLS